MSDSEIRARDAQQLLENPLLNEILNEIEKNEIDAWIDTGLAGTTYREQHWATVKAARKVHEHLRNIVDNAKFEASRAARAPLP